MIMNEFKIGNIPVGGKNKTFIIAEVAQAHEGSLGTAIAFIDAAAAAGADAIKFQTHIADAESTIDDQFRVKFSYQDSSRYAYWKRMEFNETQWKLLSEHAKAKGLVFLSSAFSIEAFNLLNSLSMPAWKIASGETSSNEILQKMIETQKPILLSTGMSKMSEILNTCEYLHKSNVDFVLLQCTSKYPTKLEEIGLNVIDDFKELGCLVGLSDHSGTIYPAMAAIARGVSVVELHLTFNKKMFGPDNSSSITFEDLSLIIDFRNAIYQMDMNPVDKTNLTHDLKKMRDLFNRSLTFKKDQPKGKIITREMLTTKKPGTGISYSDANKLLGKPLNKDVPFNRLIKWSDIDDI